MRHGASVFSVYNHMYLPLAYADDPEAAYWNLVNGVQIWDVGCERQVEISGPDAMRFAQWLTPRDLGRCEVGQAMYAPMTAEDGGMVNDPVVLRMAEDRFWFSLADSDALLWARGLAQQSGLDVMISEPDVSPLQIQGPKSLEVTCALFGDWAMDLPFYRFRETDLDGIPLVLARMGYSRERCFELFLQDGSRGEELWRRVWKAGEPHGITAGAPSQALRLEAGILSYRNDMGLADNPYQVGLGWAVDLDQPGEFIGKNALRKIEKDGISRRLVGLELGGEPLAGANEDRWPLTDGNEAIGDIRSAGYSPRLQKNIGYAMVPTGHSTPGTELLAKTPVGDCPARVVKMPWMERKP